MKPFVVLASIVLFANFAAADDDSDREKVKRDLLMPECSWSKMSKAEYEECQKKRDTMKTMSPSERKQYLDHVEGRDVIVDDTTGGYGRNIIRNRPPGGGGGRR